MPRRWVHSWVTFLFIVSCSAATARDLHGVASWYGEKHRGKLMANCRKFDPDKLTAACWSYPLGTRVRVTVQAAGRPERSICVTITDRGPSTDLVNQGRVIDLARAAFKSLAPPKTGLVSVRVEPERP